MISLMGDQDQEKKWNLSWRDGRWEKLGRSEFCWDLGWYFKLRSQPRSWLRWELGIDMCTHAWAYRHRRVLCTIMHAHIKVENFPSPFYIKHFLMTCLELTSPPSILFKTAGWTSQFINSMGKKCLHNVAYLDVPCNGRSCLRYIPCLHKWRY